MNHNSTENRYKKELEIGLLTIVGAAALYLGSNALYKLNRETERLQNEIITIKSSADTNFKDNSTKLEDKLNPPITIADNYKYTLGEITPFNSKDKKPGINDNFILLSQLCNDNTVINRLTKELEQSSNTIKINGFDAIYVSPTKLSKYNLNNDKWTLERYGALILPSIVENKGVKPGLNNFKIEYSSDKLKFSSEFSSNIPGSIIDNPNYSIVCSGNARNNVESNETLQNLIKKFDCLSNQYPNNLKGICFVDGVDEWTDDIGVSQYNWVVVSIDKTNQLLNELTNKPQLIDMICTHEFGHTVYNNLSKSDKNKIEKIWKDNYPKDFRFVFEWEESVDKKLRSLDIMTAVNNYDKIYDEDENVKKMKELYSGNITFQYNEFFSLFKDGDYISLEHAGHPFEKPDELFASAFAITNCYSKQFRQKYSESDLQTKNAVDELLKYIPRFK